eukprot:gb/GFBE01060367.1/.p1 GENE.gb/GFBE01060367.1/~~gb/GFBE01060367.1/.p1  ORF type:complete len:302 (+),score=69.08 gb/GFBE01060367.1/:1-906(+)
MKVYTVATESIGYLPALKESAAKQGVSLEVVGEGMKWGGFIWRFEQLKHHIAKLHPDELAMVIDGYDTLIMKSEVELRESFEKVGKGDSIVFASETLREDASFLFWNTLVRTSKGYFKTPDAPFLVNAGCCIGRAEDLLAYFNFLITSSTDSGVADDQRLLNTWFWSHTQDTCTAEDSHWKLKVRVDFNGELFYCHCERNLLPFCVSSMIDPSNLQTKHENNLDFADGSVVLRRSQKKIGVLHGISCANMDQICKHMDYSLPDTRKVLAQADVRRAVNTLRVVVFLLLVLLVALIVNFFQG